MHFLLQTPSLQHLAGVRIVAHLWTQRGIFTQIARLPAHQIYQEANEWKEIEKKVESKVSALPLPPLCKKHMLNLIKPLGMEIIRWCRYHCDTLLPQQVCWTMNGSIDYGKTAEVMVKDDKLDVEKRYEIACIHCLQDEARQLFESMGPERRQDVVEKLGNRREQHYHQLVLYFTCTFNDYAAHLYLRRYSEKPSSLQDKRQFEYALKYGSRATCEYFSTKLNQRETDEVVEEWRLPLSTFERASSSLVQAY